MTTPAPTLPHVVAGVALTELIGAKAGTVLPGMNRPLTQAQAAQIAAYLENIK